MTKPELQASEALIRCLQDHFADTKGEMINFRVNEVAAGIEKDMHLRELEAVVEAARDALPSLSEASADYNHPNFTDRRMAGPRLSKSRNALAKALATLDAAKEGK